MQLITRKVEIDYGHRVMNERMKCYNNHGHRGVIELSFSYNSIKGIGYQIDFKEIKRIGGQWLDDMLDHCFIANPHDTVMIEACKKVCSKLWIMSLNGKGNYCNPTAENISKEIFLAMETLFSNFEDLQISLVKFFETPNCWIETTESSLSVNDRINFNSVNKEIILNYAKYKGMVEYDDRKIGENN